MHGRDSKRPVFFQQAERSFLDLPPCGAVLAPEGPAWVYDQQEMAAVMQGLAGGAGVPEERTSDEGFPASALPVPCITGRESSRGLVGGGVDWLEFTVAGEQTEVASEGVGCFREIAALLEAARLAVANGARECLVPVMGAALSVQAKGTMWGDTWLQWFGEYDGVSYGFQKLDGRGSFAAKVRIGSLKLTRDGAYASYNDAMAVLRACGVIAHEVKLYRIDVCLDRPGERVDAYVNAMNDREVITRMKSRVKTFKRPNGEWEGASTGSKNGVQVNVYDKAVELEDRSGVESEAKRHYLQEHRWGGEFEHVARIEFQVRGEWIRRQFADVVSVEQALRALPGIVDYLVTRFFRIMDGPIDRENKNQSRARVAACWEAVVAGFVDVFGRAVEVARRQKVAFKINAESARRRLVAAAKSYVAALDPEYVGTESLAMRAIVNAVSSGCELLLEAASKRLVWQARVDKDIRGDVPGAAPLVFLGRDQIPMDRWRIEDRLVPF